MARREPYELIYDPGVRPQLAWLGSKHYWLIRDEIERQLRFEPDTETRNRKPLRRPSVLGTAWELRLGPDNRFRVFYRADRASRQVHILAVGVKTAGRLSIAGEEFQL